MKKFIKLRVIIFNICLILVSGITSALLLASSREYYRSQFEKNGIYSTEGEFGEKRRRIYFIGGDTTVSATFSDEQYNQMIDHIIDYLFTDKESFELILDGVEVWGDGSCDGVSVFGDKAISHMADVKSLIRAVIVIGAISALILIALIVFFIIKRQECAEYLLCYTGYFYAALAIFAAGFCLWSLIGAKVTSKTFLYRLWGNLHYLLFPFQPEKYENSYLSDPLTQILSLELFITALITVLVTVATAVAIWLGGAYFIKRKYKPHP